MKQLLGLNEDLSAPLWLQAAVKLGVPALIALVLVVFLMQNVTSSLRAIAEDAAASKQAANRAIDAIEQHTHDTQEMNRYFKLICMHTARNDSERDACLGR